MMQPFENRANNRPAFGRLNYLTTGWAMYGQ